MKWKNGPDNPKSVVITDFQIFEKVDKTSIFGTAGWAPPEQWIGQFMERFFVNSTIMDCL